MFSILNMKKQISLWFIFLITGLLCKMSAQEEKKFIRQGNDQYKENKFADSEVSYRKAIDKNKQSKEAGFNLGDALYKQNKYDEAGKEFLDNSSLMTNNSKKSANLYNLGNSLLKSNKIQESIEAYKNSLKLSPGNKEAKYNLAYAQDMLKMQQQQQKQQQDQKNKDDKKNNKKEDQKQDQNKDQNKEQNKNQDNKDKNKKDQQQQQQQGISKEDAQRLLNAIANDEKNVQEKVKLAKAAKEKVNSRINW
jgi:Ca-activated chloride channel family protein